MVLDSVPALGLVSDFGLCLPPFLLLHFSLDDPREAGSGKSHGSRGLSPTNGLFSRSTLKGLSKVSTGQGPALHLETQRLSGKGRQMPWSHGLKQLVMLMLACRGQLGWP